MPSTTIKGQAKIVCGAKKCAGFKSQSKPKLPFAGKALPLVKGWDVGAFNSTTTRSNPAATPAWSLPRPAENGWLRPR